MVALALLTSVNTIHKKGYAGLPLEDGTSDGIHIGVRGCGNSSWDVVFTDFSKICGIQDEGYSTQLDNDINNVMAILEHMAQNCDQHQGTVAESLRGVATELRRTGSLGLAINTLEAQAK
ncbi:hypothetical protein E1B28_005456 [Marasmius oreades]|uniref:Uncharacterized protein n=1 Tax=Marasmius oreades TaxID=181124 RepID=A0A9P7S3H4_9AGAR|nr:uncharacterized protein E1B28_005456 [Marasmius oreades]KAG7094632.1 hypothetical protein E1B28_005456 [Marasmius oreades]